MSLTERLHDWDSFTEWEPTDNDQPPTESDPWDYAIWSNGYSYVPHPDMEGVRCSTGFVHEPKRRGPTAPVGLARLPISAAHKIIGSDHNPPAEGI